MNRILQPAPSRIKNNSSFVVTFHPASGPFSRVHFPFSIFHFPLSLFSNSFPCHTSAISPVTPAFATDPKIPSRNPFACHTSGTPRLAGTSSLSSVGAQHRCALSCPFLFVLFFYYLSVERPRTVSSSQLSLKGQPHD